MIVDDRSTDDSVPVVRKWQGDHPGIDVRLIDGPGRGPGPALNLGIAAVTADLVVRLDGHCVPDPDYLEHSARPLEDPRIGVVGGTWRVHPGAATTMARAIAKVVSHPLGSGGARYRHPDSEGPVTMAVETVPFGAFRRGLWEQLGGFDESLAANQDFDFNYRARVAGFDVVLDRRIRATYFARSTLGALRQQYFRYGFWKRQMLRKDPRAFHWRQAPPVLVLPWVLATGVSAVMWPSPLTVLAAGLYPVVLLLGVAHLAARGANAPAALAALATLHLSWSAGFWRALLGGGPPGS